MESSSFLSRTLAPCTALIPPGLITEKHDQAHQCTGGRKGYVRSGTAAGAASDRARGLTRGTTGPGERCFGIKRGKQLASQEGGRRTGGRNGNCPIAVNPLCPPPFPGEGQTVGAEPRAGSGGISSQAPGQRDPPQAQPRPRAAPRPTARRGGEQPCHPPPGTRSTPPYRGAQAGGGKPFPLPRPGGTHRLGGGGLQEEAEQQGGAEHRRDAGQRHGWAVRGGADRNRPADGGTGSGRPPPPSRRL